MVQISPIPNIFSLIPNMILARLKHSQNDLSLLKPMPYKKIYKAILKIVIGRTSWGYLFIYSFIGAKNKDIENRCCKIGRSRHLVENIQPDGLVDGGEGMEEGEDGSLVLWNKKGELRLQLYES